MTEWRRELNEAIGIIRAMQEYLGEDHKLIVDVSVQGMPTILTEQKKLILSTLAKVESTLMQESDRLCKNYN